MKNQTFQTAPLKNNRKLHTACLMEILFFFFIISHCTFNEETTFTDCSFNE